MEFLKWMEKPGTWAIAAFSAFATIFMKDVATTYSKQAVTWFANFFAMPGEVQKLKKRVGSNGEESVFDMLHRLDLKAEAVLVKERLRADRLGELVWHSNEKGECVWASKALLELVGYTFDEGFRGYAWVRLFRDEDRVNVVEDWNSSVAERVFFYHNTVYVTKAGVEIPVKIEAHPLPGDGIVGMVTVVPRVL